MHNIGKNRHRLHVTRLEDRDVPATLPTGFSEFGVTGIISAATAMEFAPDGKLFVLEQAGTMEVYQGTGATNWTQLSSNFFTGNLLTVNSSGERGLLGIAFDPNYVANRFLYVYYTATTPAIHNRISRFTANAAGTQVVAGSEAVIMDLENLSATNHNGGAMHFGPDGMLYVAVGENANAANSQSIANRLGKMLRLNPVPGNAIPADNPTSIAGITGTTSGNNRAIWAAGLRNPYTFTFHPTTGQMYINDVGQNAWEEVNVGSGGTNYGWSSTEGRFNPASFPNFTNPIIAYRHSSGAGTNYPPGNDYEGFAITGGAFYVSANYPFPQDYIGDYFFADYVSDWIRRYDATTNTVINFATSALGAVDLRVGTDGCLYYLARDASGGGSGRVFRVNFTGSLSPYIITNPNSQTVAEGQPVTFSAQAGGPGTLTYQWQRNNVDIPGANSSSYTINMVPSTDNNATFRVVVTNSTGTATSTAATLTVNLNQTPTGTILTPTIGTTFSYGDTIAYSGSATDPEEGNITNPARFTWWVTYHTGGVEQPFIPEFSGVTSGNFNIPTSSPYTAPDVFYRVHLRVTDGLGAIHETTRDLQPNTAVVTMATNPTGGILSLDGNSQSTPHLFTGVTGQHRTIAAPVSTTIDGMAYSFSTWSDGGAASHTISTPASNTTYTANYVLRPARVALFQVNDGSAQRSMVRSLRLTFDAILSPTTALNDAFTLVGPSGPIPFTAGPVDNTTGQSIVPIMFTGPGLENGSLQQGVYSLTVIGNQLIDGLGAALDGDANGSAGGNYVTEFHRLFGDADGNRTVNPVDFGTFRSAFGLGSQAPGFLEFLDQNGDGLINAADFAAFRAAYGLMI